MSKQNKTILIIAVIFIVAVSLIFIVNKNKNQQNQPGRVQGNEYNVSQLRPIDQTDHIRGDINASVKMIVYSDFKCLFCAQFTDTIKKVEQEFKDKVAIAFRHYPLSSHSEANQAALASECAAEQGKFWQMHDKLFADNVAGRMSSEQFKKDAVDLGLDQVKFSQCLDSGKYQDRVYQEMLEGKNAGVTGTPTSFVNGNIYPGAYPFEDFTAPDGQPEKGMKSIISELLK